MSDEKIEARRDIDNIDDWGELRATAKNWRGRANAAEAELLNHRCAYVFRRYLQGKAGLICGRIEADHCPEMSDEPHKCEKRGMAHHVFHRASRYTPAAPRDGKEG